MNCRNCGAPLRYTECEYCRSRRPSEAVYQTPLSAFGAVEVSTDQQGFSPGTAEVVIASRHWTLYASPYREGQ